MKEVDKPQPVQPVPDDAVAPPAERFVGIKVFFSKLFKRGK